LAAACAFAVATGSGAGGGEGEDFPISFSKNTDVIWLQHPAYYSMTPATEMMRKCRLFLESYMKIDAQRSLIIVRRCGPYLVSADLVERI